MKLNLNDRLGLNNIINNLQVQATEPKYIGMDLHLEPILSDTITMGDLVSVVNALYLGSQLYPANERVNSSFINNDKLIDIEVIISRVLDHNPDLPYVLSDIDLNRAYTILSGISCPTFVTMIEYLTNMDKGVKVEVKTPNLEVMYEDLENIKSLLGLMFQHSDWETPLGDINLLNEVYAEGVTGGLDEVELGQNLYNVKYPIPKFFKPSEEEALETLRLYKFIRTLKG